MISLSESHRIIHWWTGTDALKLVMYPPGPWWWHVKIFLERALWYLVEPMIWEHWVVDENLVSHLCEFGIEKHKIKVRHDPVKYPRPVKKEPHDKFTVMYYYPGDRGNAKFKRWVYGMDIIEYLKSLFDPNKIIWIEADGSLDMYKIYAVTDLYIRPTRHDGRPRMIDECKINGIEYIYEPDLQKDLTFFWIVFYYYEAIKFRMEVFYENQKNAKNNNKS